jgi:hypothetical protein
LRRAEQELLKTLGRFWADAGDTIRANRIDAAVAALNSSVDWDLPMYQAAGLSRGQIQVLRDGATALSERNVQIMVRRFTTRQIPLSNQVYRTESLTKGWVQGVINRAVGRGLSARELAAEVRQFIRPDVRGGVSFAAMRLARTELNNAHHAAAISSIIDKPWVEGMQWTLSGSHPKTDICDSLATENKFDRGPGVFPRNEVPPKPHPQCFCYLVPKQVDEDDFVAAFQRGSYDQFLSKLAG